MNASPVDRPFPQNLAATALAVAFLAAAPGAQAQATAPATPPATGEGDEAVQLEKFLVTGSSIPVTPNRIFQPVVTVDQQRFDELGVGTAVEALRTIPAFFGNNSTEQRSNGGTGNAGVNLRGLAGTLTLLDGHRTAAFDELNLLPRIALERFEVVKDGASARYGADALTGVFNTILVPRFSGQKLQAYYGNTTDKDAGVLRLGLLAGAGNSRTDVVVAAETYDRNALMARDRAVSADPDARAQGGQNRRSSSFSGRTMGRRSPGGAIENLTLAPGRAAAFAAGDFVPFDTNAYTSDQFANFREFTPSIPEQKDESVYARINHSILKDGLLDAYARFLYSQNEYDSAVIITNSGTNVSAALASVSPHLPAGYTPTGNTAVVPAVLGARGRNYQRDAYDFQFGLKGRLFENWSWDATYVYGWWYRDDRQSNALSATRLLTAIQDGSYNPFALDSASGTNPNNGRAFDNPAALRAASVVGRIDHDFGLRGGDARVSGPVFSLPAGEVEFGTGFDYYITEASTVPDAVISGVGGPYLGLNATGYSASGYTSKGAFVETIVPVVAPSMNIPWVRSFELTASVRHTEKEIEGTTPGNGTVILGRTFDATSPKAGVRYQPCHDVTIRSTYAEGFRTPGLSFLFAAPSTFAAGVVDPLGFPPAGLTTSATAQGNPNLDAERSKTWSTGVVIEPRQIRGLRVEMDYYYGQVRGLVGDGAQYILNINAMTQGPGFIPGNPATINPSATFSDRIVRNAAGTVTLVRSTPFNISSREASGLDYAVTYTWPLVESGRWVSRLAGNTTLSWDLLPVPGFPSQNWLGRFVDTGNNAISPGSIPRHKGYFTQSWQKGAWAVYGTFNYVSKLEDDRNWTYQNQFRHIEAWRTFDAQVAYTFDSQHPLFHGLDVRVGASNVTDEPAPFAAGAFNDNYDVTTHSNRGRFVYVQVTKTF
jgi:iron complex outermembrane recepter protein